MRESAKHSAGLSLEASSRAPSSAGRSGSRPGDRLRSLLMECVRRRAAGEELSDDEIIRDNADLMPALARELALLRVMRRASQHVGTASNGSSSAHNGASAESLLMRQDAIPGYRLVREIHRGGQGVVYAARQDSTGREVAIKILHSGAFAGPSDRSRFQREVEILARLRHPNIVAIHDTGTAGGAQFYVMDLIDGRPLGRHLPPETKTPLARRKLREDLALFAKVCEAVHSAHLRGVIHRDLKPGNVLVDAAGEPHVLDFGLAKEISEASRSSVTAEGQFVGSIPWASPEQVSGATDIDVRTDVYSLGVVLFQLLTGTFPYRVTGPMAEVFQSISSAPPQRPSGLQRLVDRELDTIVLKCLSKEPERRYQSAGDVARDVRNYLAGQPIDARRDSNWYLLQKMLRRHRAAFAGAALVTVGAIVLAAYQSGQSRRLRQLATEESAARVTAQQAQTQAEQAEKKAAQERDDAQRARDAESEQRRLAESQAERAESVTAFLVNTLGLADPDVTQSADPRMKNMLDAAAARVGAAFDDHPVSEAAVRLVIGRAYATLGDLDAAREQLRRAVEIHETLQSPPATTYEVLWPYVQVLEEAGARDYIGQRTRLWRMYPNLVRPWDARLPAVLAAWRDLMGENHDAANFQSLEDEFFQIAGEAVPADDPRWLIVADFLHLGGANLTLRDFPAQGLAQLRRALDIERRFLPETHTRIIRTLGELVRSSIDAGLHAEAEALTRESLLLVQKALPADHWYVAVYQARLGACLIGQSRFTEAESLLLENLARIEAARGTTNALAREVVERIIDLYDAWSRPDAAEPWRISLAKRVVGSDQESRPSNRLKRIFGPEHADLFKVLDEFNWSRLSDRGIAAFHALVPLRRARFTDDDVRAAVVAECLCAAASVLANRNTYNDDTLAMMREAERIARAGDDLHPRKKAYILWNVARQIEPRGEFEEVERVSREVLAIIEPLYGDAHGLAMNARLGIGVALLGQGRAAEAEPVLIADFDRRLAQNGPAHTETRNALLRLIDLYDALGRPDVALPHAHAVSRGQWLEWKEIKPIFVAKYPLLAEAMDALVAAPVADVDRIAAAIRALLDARRAAFDLHDPAAMVYSGALHRLARGRTAWTYHPVWIPAQREVREITLVHMPADWTNLAIVDDWLASLYMRCGAFAEAETLTREAREISRKRIPENLYLNAYRDHAWAATGIGQGRAAEAERLMMASFDTMLGESVHEPFGSEYFGYVVLLYTSLGRPDEIERLLAPVLRRETARRENAFQLRRLIDHIVAQPGLPEALYQLAADAALVANEMTPDNGYLQLALATTRYRLGQYGAALRGLEAPQKPPGSDAAVHAAFSAMTHARLGHTQPARDALERCRERVGALGAMATVHDRALLCEAETLLHGTD